MSLKERLKEEELQDLTAETVQALNDYRKEISQKGAASPETKFILASLLSRRPSVADKRQAKQLLLELLQLEPTNRNYLYFLAVVSYKLEDYRDARLYATKLLEQEPNNRQAYELQQMVHDQIQKDGLVGMAILGGFATAVGIGSILLIKGLSRK